MTWAGRPSSRKRWAMSRIYDALKKAELEGRGAGSPAAAPARPEPLEALGQQGTAELHVPPAQWGGGPPEALRELSPGRKLVESKLQGRERIRLGMGEPGAGRSGTARLV